MDAKGLIQLAEKYKEHKDFISNEEMTKMALVVPFLRLLGYDPNNPREVRLEYTAEFTAGDGKRLPDRMDYAIFDEKGERPLMILEVKPLGSPLEEKVNQLARYLAQMPELHFGIITDGCHYRFYGDLENPNTMDKGPFFSFALDDDKEDWTRVADFLGRFGREQFNATTLVTDAENSRYRREMVKKLTATLRDPASDEEFLKWLVGGVYSGKKTVAVMQRLATVAQEAVEPALLKVLGSGIAETIRQRFGDVEEGEPAEAEAKAEEPEEVPRDDGSGIVTTAEELEFYRLVKQVCAREGHPEDQILYKDTKTYFNVSYRKPTKYFARFIARKARKEIYTLVPIAEAQALCPGYTVEESPNHMGKSRLVFEEVSEVWALRPLILRSLEILNGGGGQEEVEGEENGKAVP